MQMSENPLYETWMPTVTLADIFLYWEIILSQPTHIHTESGSYGTAF